MPQIRKNTLQDAKSYGIIVWLITAQKMQRYRSGHNGADSKSVCEQSHEGSNPSRCAILNTTRVSNFFIEIRVVSYLESLAIQGFPFFCVWLMCIGKHQNCEDVFIRRHRYMNTAFRYNYLDMLLQTLAVSCISASDVGESHCKNGYIHPRSFESAVQKYIRAGRLPLF